MSCFVEVVKEGYSYLREDGLAMTANCTCTLIQGPAVCMIVDPLTAWDKDFILQYLQKRGINPDAVSHVVCTHGHSDHIGNLNLFLKATHIVGQSISSYDVYSLHPFEKGEPYRVSNDIQVIPTQGHTLSDVSVVVQTQEYGKVVIAGDLFEREEDIDNPSLWREIAGSENPEMQMQNRQHVLDIADYIIPGHGPMFVVTDCLRRRHAKLLQQENIVNK